MSAYTDSGIYALNQRLARLEAIVSLAREYTKRSHHVDKCPVRERRGVCTCGLDDLLDAIQQEDKR